MNLGIKGLDNHRFDVNLFVSEVGIFIKNDPKGANLDPFGKKP